MDKKDIRVYLDADFCDHLKSIAKDKGISVNSLVSELVKKKYPMQSKDISIKLNDDKIVLLKKAAQERNTTISELLISLVDDFLLSVEQPALDEIPLDAGTGETASTIACESENVQPVDVEEPTATDDYRKQKERRLADVNYKLKRAYNGDKLPKDEFQQLRDEQASLRAELGHN